MNKNQQKNRMGTVIILLAAACLNGYAQHDTCNPSLLFFLPLIGFLINRIETTDSADEPLFFLL